MTFRSPTQPLCRYCGGAIKKHTHAVFFGQSTERHDDFSKSLSVKPRSKAEAQKHTNARVVSVTWWPRKPHVPSGWPAGLESYISRVGTWDGQTYDDEFFCSNVCINRFAYLYARSGHATKRYNEALAARTRIMGELA